MAMRGGSLGVDLELVSRCFPEFVYRLFFLSEDEASYLFFTPHRFKLSLHLSPIFN